ncbi:MAG TPA: nucleotide exchange factor GrpE [Candidatus Wildermuthbacteria bacterium]|nr:nucleotide exchange factor GrpE [Candidatus Wildermuthbacteria bacterium]
MRFCKRPAGLCGHRGAQAHALLPECRINSFFCRSMGKAVEIEKIKKEHDEYLDGWKRAKADFLNYKKEENERLQAVAEYARRELLRKILRILDNLARAEREIAEEQKDDKFVKGFLQIVSQWREFLKSEGIEEIETVGTPFNPELHEAVEEVAGDPSTGSEQRESGMVAEEVEKGYMVQGRLLRPAKVKVVK